jgi:hypothetical protein
MDDANVFQIESAAQISLSQTWQVSAAGNGDWLFQSSSGLTHYYASAMDWQSGYGFWQFFATAVKRQV